LGNDGMMWADDSLVFYNKRESNDGAIKHIGDNHDGVAECAEGDEGDEIIILDLHRVSVKTNTILAVLTLFLCNPNKGFDPIEVSANVKLYSEVPNGSQLLCSYDLREVIVPPPAMEMASLTRDGDGWSFQAIGQGIDEGKSANGLVDVLRKYSR